MIPEMRNNRDHYKNFITTFFLKLNMLRDPAFLCPVATLPLTYLKTRLQNQFVHTKNLFLCYIYI